MPAALTTRIGHRALAASQTTRGPSHGQPFAPHMFQSPAGRFSFAADLLYPAALGAGIAWWCEGFIGWRADETPRALALWALLFGMFFIVYHARNFLVLRHEYGGEHAGRQNHEYYYPPTFARDVIDCLALVAAFMCLRFPGGHIRLADPVGVYLIAFLIPLGALITDARSEKISWCLRAVACVPPVFGLAMAAFADDERFAPQFIDWAVLVALCLLLVAYLIKPGLFGVRTLAEMRSSDMKGPERVLRVALAGFVSFLLLVIATWRVKAEPPAIDPERWTFAGRIGNFAVGRPCRADPPLVQQLMRFDSILVGMRPSRIRLVGSADAEPLTPLTRDFVGNNAGLAHFRAVCVERWLQTTDHFAGVAFETDDGPPTHLDAADPIDRAVLVFVMKGSMAVTRHSERP